MKQVAQTQLEARARVAILDCLAQVPFVRAEAAPDSNTAGAGSADIDLVLYDHDQMHQILVQAKYSGEPRIARDAVNQLLRWRDGHPGSYAVFAAPYISARAADICAREGVGYVDLAGNCRLALEKIFIERSGRPNPFAGKRDLRSLYSPKAERILRALLVEPKRFWQVQELAKETEVSLGQVSNVKAILRDREWLETETGTPRFRVADPGALLTEWSQQARPDRSISHKFYSLSPLPTIEHELAVMCRDDNIPYALTGLSAATRYAPYARSPRASAYVTGDVELLAERLGWKSVEAALTSRCSIPTMPAFSMAPEPSTESPWHLQFRSIWISQGRKAAIARRLISSGRRR